MTTLVAMITQLTIPPVAMTVAVPMTIPTLSPGSLVPIVSVPRVPISRVPCPQVSQVSPSPGTLSPGSPVSPASLTPASSVSLMSPVSPHHCLSLMPPPAIDATASP
ncbi:PREDICTED: proline-rich receptor-like protein kinase PERK2 [Nipponia nippon]|uniref:proline-rich receptor-like protein kinase PERK2 n=1 Tax=Nipponia nippon TaxID=128390 RepID=UPI00051127FA|nr:PREDICTED: proline-rich receptor-like protein kinase PERK2 [Nipponia nippon]